LLCLSLWTLSGCGDGARWEAHTAEGLEAFEQGYYGEAERQFLAALDEAERFLFEDMRLVASLDNLARVYWAQGAYVEAEPLLKRALAIGENILGSEHPDLASGLHNLATLYRDQRAYAKAEPVLKRALAIEERALGPEHPDLASGLHNLGML
jgi:tetratricopeptide (TPR) repeat protein